MKNYFKPLFIACSVMTAATFVSCGDDNSGLEPGVVDPNINGYTLNITDTSLTPEITVLASQTNETQDVSVHFEGADKGMRRLYITKNDGTGREIYDVNDYIAPAVSVNKDDGSIDLAAANKESFDFVIPFATPATKNSVVVYKLWATGSGFLSTKGDVVNESFRNAYDDVAVGTVIVKIGTPASVKLREFSAKLLYAPDKFGQSKSFISVLDGNTYNISKQVKDVTSGTSFSSEEQQKNAEYVSYWDFGYFYTGSKGACLSSAHDYMNAFQINAKPVIDITKMSGLSQSQLNSCYFKKGSSLDFNSISNSADLEVIKQGSGQTVMNLSVGNLIEFVDAHGNKGLIKIDKIKKGHGSKTDYIKFSVKVQSSDYVKL